VPSDDVMQTPNGLRGIAASFVSGGSSTDRVPFPRSALYARHAAPQCGGHPKVVSERLGHASIGITLDTYSHVMPGVQEEAVEKIDAGLRAALAG
jgi:integrase